MDFEEQLKTYESKWQVAVCGRQYVDDLPPAHRATGVTRKR
jgi:hypothetical protein